MYLLIPLTSRTMETIGEDFVLILGKAKLYITKFMTPSVNTVTVNRDYPKPETEPGWKDPEGKKPTFSIKTQ